ncbi:hypothetical protein TWF696_002667 [Orbilia brochopaga]|uniref:Uncharacterized protein n=1 Tax=Orbilia brochopaga TaxID=3140254 RepID=A0AAV9U6J1_9PEZI
MYCLHAVAKVQEIRVSIDRANLRSVHSHIRHEIYHSDNISSVVHNTSYPHTGNTIVQRRRRTPIVRRRIYVNKAKQMSIPVEPALVPPQLTAVHMTDECTNTYTGINYTGDGIVVYLKLQTGMQPFSLCEEWTLATALEKIHRWLYEIGYLSGSDTCDLQFDHTSARELVLLLSRTQQPQETLLVGHVFYGTEMLDVRICEVADVVADMACGDDELAMAGMKLAWIRARNERLRSAHPQVESQDGDVDGGELSAVVFVGVDEFRMVVVKRYVYAEGVVAMGGAGAGLDGCSWQRRRKRRGCGEVVEMDAAGGRCVVRDASTGTQRVLRYRPRRGLWIEEQL